MRKTLIEINNEKRRKAEALTRLLGASCDPPRALHRGVSATFLERRLAKGGAPAAAEAEIVADRARLTANLSWYTNKYSDASAWGEGR